MEEKKQVSALKVTFDWQNCVYCRQWTIDLQMAYIQCGYIIAAIAKEAEHHFETRSFFKIYQISM